MIIFCYEVGLFVVIGVYVVIFIGLYGRVNVLEGVVGLNLKFNSLGKMLELKLLLGRMFCCCVFMVVSCDGKGS